jgi:hypothetical protein
VPERLLVTTRNKLLIWDDSPVYIRDEWPYRSTHYATIHYFFGATWDTETIYVNERLTSKEGAVHTFDREFNWKGELPLKRKPKAPHQMIWWEGKLYIADPNTNRVLIWDGDSTRTYDVRAIALSPNCVWCDGEKVYVLGHGGSMMPKWIGVFDLGFNLIDRIELPRRIFPENPRISHGAHNVYIENGILHTFSPTSIMRYDLTSRESDHVNLAKVGGTNYYTRGLARTQGRFFVGLSAIKERKERFEGDSLILVTDDDFNVLDVLTLEYTGGLHDIRAVDSVDLAHNRIRCPLLKGEKYGKGVGGNPVEE